MLKNKEAIATIAVKDLDRAKAFYGNTLGLESEPIPEPCVLAYKSGGSSVLVYQSEFAGTNKATSATWVVGEELAATVKALKAKGVRFEHYDLPDTKLEGDIHVSGKTRVAWCKDPDGNILSLVNGPT